MCHTESIFEDQFRVKNSSLKSHLYSLLKSTWVLFQTFLHLQHLFKLRFQINIMRTHAALQLNASFLYLLMIRLEVTCLTSESCCEGTHTSASASRCHQCIATQ